MADETEKTTSGVPSDLLVKAIIRNDLEQVEALLRDGADVNAFTSRGFLPLGVALNVASDPVGFSKLPPEEALPKDTPPSRLRQMVEILLKAGAEISIKDRMPLPIVAYATEPSIFLYLVDVALARANGDLKKAAKILKVGIGPLEKNIKMAKGLLAQR